MTSHAKADLTQGSIPRHLMRMTIPMIWGILAIISFQLVDAYYIAQLGTAQMASMSYTFPVTYGIFSVFIGFGIATSSVVSRMIGEKRTEDMKRVTSHSLILVFIASLAFAVLGIALIHPLFSAMGANESEIAMISDFMIPYFIGTFFVSMPVVGNAALRAGGDAVRPAIIMTIAAVTNAAINPVLIFGLFGFPRMELTGAAVGTIFANALAMFACLTLMHKRNMIDWLHIKDLYLFKDSAKRILMIALPAGITSMLPSFLNATITHTLSKTSVAAVAAFGIVTRVEAFTLVILMALSIGMAPIIGQNWGAGKLDRVRETVKTALIFCVFWSGVVAVVLTLGADGLSSLFTDDAAVQHFIALYCVVVSFSYVFGNISNGWGSTFNAVGKPHISAIILFGKAIVLGVPAVLIGFYTGGVIGCFIALAVVNTLSGVVVHVAAWRWLKNIH